MKYLTLNVSPRSKTGSNAVKQLRTTGKIPAVIYGKSGNHNIQIEESDFKALRKKISDSVSFIEIQEQGKKPLLSLIREIQRDPTTDQFKHIDFREITRGKPITADITVHIEGEAYGIKNEKGVLETHVHKIQVKCRPSFLPQYISVDISALHVGDALHIKDLQPIEGVEFLGNPKTVIVSCLSSRLSNKEEVETESKTDVEKEKE
jgi:large subunit ribosomal protein L25